MVHENAEESKLPSCLEWRIRNYEMLFVQSVTPLLRQELHRASRMHRGAIDDLKLQKDPQYLQELDIVHQRLQEHWTKVFGDLISHSRLTANIGKFQSFVAGSLQEDYTGKPYTVKLFDVDQAFLVAWHDAAVEAGFQDIGGHSRITSDESAGSQVRVGNECFAGHQNELLLEAYNLSVVYPLQELLFVQEAVENRLRMIEDRGHRQGGKVQNIIDQRDWPKLATTLVQDKRLALELAEQNTVVPGLFGYDKKVAVLRGIDQTRSKYFSSLSSPANYALSKHALELSAETVSPDTEKSTATVSVSQLDLAGSSWKNRARNIFNAFAEGLQGGRVKPTLRSLAHPTPNKESFDEKDPLIGSEKA